MFDIFMLFFFRWNCYEARNVYWVVFIILLEENLHRQEESKGGGGGGTFELTHFSHHTWLRNTQEEEYYLLYFFFVFTQPSQVNKTWYDERMRRRRDDHIKSSSFSYHIIILSHNNTHKNRQLTKLAAHFDTQNRAERVVVVEEKTDKRAENEIIFIKKKAGKDIAWSAFKWLTSQTIKVNRPTQNTHTKLKYEVYTMYA